MRSPPTFSSSFPIAVDDRVRISGELNQIAYSHSRCNSNTKSEALRADVSIYKFETKVQVRIAEGIVALFNKGSNRKSDPAMGADVNAR